MRDLESSIQTSRDMVNSGSSTEEVIARLRHDGFEVIDSIKILAKATAIDLAAAKRAVHLSDTWSDRRKGHEAFHDQVEGGAREESTRGE